MLYFILFQINRTIKPLHLNLFIAQNIWIELTNISIAEIDRSVYCKRVDFGVVQWHPKKLNFIGIQFEVNSELVQIANANLTITPRPKISFERVESVLKTWQNNFFIAPTLKLRCSCVLTTLNHALIASNKISLRSVPRSIPRSHNVCTAPTASSPRPIGSHYAQTTQSLRLNNAHRVSARLSRSYWDLTTLWAHADCAFHVHIIQTSSHFLASSLSFLLRYAININ